MDIDKVQLLALLAALIGVDRTVSAGRRVWGDETMVSLLPFVQEGGHTGGHANPETRGTSSCWTR